MINVKTFLANLSHHPGVYQMLGSEGEVLYVGKAKDLKKRVSQYFNVRAKDPKTLSLVKQIRDIDVTVTHSETEAVLLECNLIKKHKPYYNVLLRDDKSYPYILITEHDYPRVDLYRGSRKKKGLFFGPYPNASAVRETISLLQKLFHLRTCRDSVYASRARPCLLYQIGRCSGPCVGLINKEQYAHNIKLAILFLQGKSNEVITGLQEKMEEASTALNFELAAHYRDQINRLRQIQERQYINVAEGEADIIAVRMESGIAGIHLLSFRHGQLIGSRSYFPRAPHDAELDDILNAFLTQHYVSSPSHMESIPKEIIVAKNVPDHALLEKALSDLARHKVHILIPVRGEKKKWLKMAETNVKHALVAHLFSKSNTEERLKAIQRLFALPKPPERVECFDISHTMGEATVASCVVFDNQGPRKRDYRRYNIQDITPGDDVAAMQQVIRRRLMRIKKENLDPPEIMFIDGGKGQLHAAEQVRHELGINNIMLVGVSKGPGRKAGDEALHRIGYAPIHLAADDLALHYIQQIRDEAHRFAVMGHRQRRDKTRRQSSIELVPGIGAKRRRELLRYFGGIQGVAHASLDELTKVPGISRFLAERIFATLHDTTI